MTRPASAAALAVAVLLLFAAVAFLARGRGALMEGARGLQDDNRVLSEAVDEARARGRELKDELETERERASALEESLTSTRRALFLSKTIAAARASESGRWTTFDAELEGVPEEHRDWLWRHLGLRRALAVRAVDTDGAAVTAVALAPGGTRFAAGTGDGVVYLGDVADGEADETLLLEDEEVSALALSADGALVAVGTYSGLVEVWAAGEEESRDWIAADEAPSGLAFLPGGDGLAAAFSDGAVCVLRFADEDPLWLEGHTFPANAVAVSPDGSRVATAADDETVQVYSGDDFAEVRVLEGHGDWVRTVAFDGDDRLVSGAEDGEVIVWDAKGGEPLERLQTGDGLVAGVAAAEGELIVVSERGDVRTWRGRAVERAELPLGPGGPLSVAPAIAPVGVVAYVADSGVSSPPPRATTGHQLHLRNPAGRRARVVLRPDGGALRAVAANADGSLLAAACADGTLRVLEGTNGAPVSTARAGGGIVRAVALSPDGALLASGSREVTVFDARTGEVRHTFGEDRRFVSLAFAEDGGELLAVGSDGSGHLFDLTAGELVRESSGPPGLVFAVAAGPAARRFAWIGDGGTVRVWDARTGERFGAQRERDLGRVDWLALSGEGTRLGAVINGTGLSVLGVGEQRTHVRARGPDLMYFSIALSPSGERFAAGTYEGQVALFDAPSGTFLALLHADESGIAALEFTRDGSRLIAGSGSGGLFVWGTDADAHERLARGTETAR